LNIQAVRFVAGSLELGYLCDETGPPTKTSSRRTRWVARTGSDSPAVTLELEQDASNDLVPVDQGTQTEEPEKLEQVEMAVQTDSAARAFSTVRKDLPQFSRPAKHSIK